MTLTLDPISVAAGLAAGLLIAPAAILPAVLLVMARIAGAQARPVRPTQAAELADIADEAGTPARDDDDESESDTTGGGDGESWRRWG